LGSKQKGYGMLRKASNWLIKISTDWSALIGLVVFLLFTALVLPGQAHQAEVYSRDVGSPDTSFYYPAEKLYQFAESYGAQGRQAYIQARWTFDVVWPLVYTYFLTTAISWLTKKASQQDSQVRTLNLIPVFGMVLDFLENAAASIVMARFPSPTPILAELAGLFTAFKWVLIGASFLALFFLLILAIWKVVRRPKQTLE
jgi:hypothetical protein